MIHVLAMMFAVVCAAGCQPGRAAEPAPGTPDADASVDVQANATGSRKTPDRVEVTAPGVKLSYPREWKREDSKEYAVLVAPTSDKSKQSVSLEIPKLPAHVPGLIPLGSVVKGYIDDMKKQHPGVKVDEPKKTNVAGTIAKRVRATWEEKGVALLEDAVLVVHGDRVFIFRGNATKQQSDAAGKSVDDVLSSVKWK